MKKFLNMPVLDTVLPCVADPGKIRFTALLDRDISPILPYINAVLKGAIYNREGHTLTIKRERKILTLYPNKITGAKIDDREDAQSILSELTALINDCHERSRSLSIFASCSISVNIKSCEVEMSSSRIPSTFVKSPSLKSITILSAANSNRSAIGS